MFGWMDGGPLRLTKGAFILILCDDSSSSRYNINICPTHCRNSNRVFHNQVVWNLWHLKVEKNLATGHIPLNGLDVAEDRSECERAAN